MPNDQGPSEGPKIERLKHCKSSDKCSHGFRESEQCTDVYSLDDLWDLNDHPKLFDYRHEVRPRSAVSDEPKFLEE